MKYKEFVKWCNERALDGVWTAEHAKICANIIAQLNTVPFWKRERKWISVRVRLNILDIVSETNNKLALSSISKEAFDMLCEYFLGEGYYITDPVSQSQANAIMVSDIIKRYKSLHKAENLKVRKWINL